jgi:hypothetical protein
MMRSREVPIAELEAARASAEAMFPGLVANVLWTPASAQADICVEFRLDTGGRKVVPWANGRPAS